MRQIKFRAWHKDRKGFAHCDIQQGAAEPWQQFTGLLDKAGREIYEGDIVEFEHLESKWREEIKWHASNHREHSCSGFGIFSAWSFCEVIGNIYESPELLNALPPR